MSVKFTVDMPDEENKWLEDQAKKAVRSKNGQLVYLVKLAMNIHKDETDDCITEIGDWLGGLAKKSQLGKKE